MIFVIIYLAVICCVILSITTSRAKKKASAPSPIVEKDHRWHSPEGEYTQNHKDRVDNHLVKHPEPEPGYVVLNGVKRKIEDCRNL